MRPVRHGLVDEVEDRVQAAAAIVRTLSQVFGTVRAFLSGQIDFREAGRRILVSLGEGILSAVSYPYGVLKGALSWLRRLLPFSNAAEGPLSNLIGSGAALLRTLAQGMLSVATLPAQAMSFVLQRMLGGARWIWGGLRSIGSQVISTMSGALSSGAQNLAASAYQSGRAMMTTIATGIRSAMSVPYDAAKSVLLRLRRLLPFSDAKEGPLSTLTRSGAAMLEAFSSGITGASKLPARAFEQAFAFARHAGRSAMLPTALAGTLALTPSLAGALPNVAAPVPVQRVTYSRDDERAQQRSQLLAATRGSVVPGSRGDAGSLNDARLLLEAILSKLDEVADRPVDVTVTTNLDGRKIAQSVYKDMRDRKVRNYGSA